MEIHLEDKHSSYLEQYAETLLEYKNIRWQLETLSDFRDWAEFEEYYNELLDEETRLKYKFDELLKIILDK